MQEISSEKPLIGADNNSLIALLSINLVVYAFIGFLKTVYYLNSYPLEQFYAQIVHPSILFSNFQTLLHQPWSLLTYNWAQDGFWILLTNMIWLTAFGIVLQESNANKHLFPIYFYSGLVGGIVFCFIGAKTPLMGASISVMAIAIAAITLRPQYRLLKNIGGGIPLWVLVTGYLVIQVFSFKEVEIAIVLAHLIAATIGFIYILLLKKGHDLGKWMHQLLHLMNKSLAPKNNS
jgi:membrane associated rhomboid family serine protease